ncbi:hypothetical protein KR52_03050 [Synechococcus sp. KORDI-52]|uniref:hypothetical protein n=1 Tax=Synechococcus sp. KORDI-52 TaxID=585425 RepID=UPI0004E09634|nr:hypothetical protein [Synechococcus sp. KORDI-52]AII48135.1 hypothetical protein KR52_03050 [Synechococcus sp. KORDI-52]
MESKPIDATLLTIAQVMALSDGSISDEEKDLILDLPNRHGLSAGEPMDLNHLPSLTELAQRLENPGDKALAARIAGLVAGVSKNTAEEENINSQEREAYRELLAALNLPEQEIAEIEWSVKKDLQKGRSWAEIIIGYVNQGVILDPGSMGPPMPL